MKLKVKRLNANAVLPKYSIAGDACLDLVATSKNVTVNYVEYGTGIAVEIPKGFVGLIFPRSSICYTSLTLTNSVGVIDSGYTGEIKFRFALNASAALSIVKDALSTVLPMDFNLSDSILKEYEVGNKLGQLLILPFPSIEVEEVDELASSERGIGGFGSTGA